MTRFNAWLRIIAISGICMLFVPHEACGQPGGPVTSRDRPDARRVADCREIRVATASELVRALQPPDSGCATVIVTGDLDLSFQPGCHANGSCQSAIRIAPGITLRGERGLLGRRPIISTRSKCQPDFDDQGAPTCVGFDLFQIASSNVHIAGLHFRGPANGSRTDEQNVTAIAILTDPADKPYNVRVAESEFNEWTSAIRIDRNPWPARPAPAGVSYVPEDAARIVILGNYFHHNAKESKGYGIVVGGNAFATAEGNVFDFNRHAMAASGDEHSGYVARHNYVLEGGYKEDGYYNQHFDVHGSLEGGYGGWAGEYFLIHHNTFRGDQSYRAVQTRPAFMLRGTPRQGAEFNANIAVHDDLDAAVKLKASLRGALGIEDHDSFNFSAAGNQFATDYHDELATGDFDGDGRTDVFVATGTAWFFSRGGQAPWEYLHASDKRTRQLGFADIDNDGITDVLYRDGAGNLGYLKSGRQPLRALTSVPVAMTELRFGDFDGDRMTDIFYTHAGQWNVWYAKDGARGWTPTQTSGKPVTDMVFGDVDAIPGTDVIARENNGWSYSSGGTSAWRMLNPGQGNSLRQAVAADFDGDGHVDIAMNQGRAWVYAPRGRGALRPLRDAADPAGVDMPALKSLLVGRFDGDPEVEVVGFVNFALLGTVSSPNQLFVWRGDRAGSFAPLSWHAMR